MRKISVGVVAGLAALTSAPRASAEAPPVILSWTAPARGDCPDAAYVLGEINRYVGSAPERQRASIKATVVIREGGLGRWRLVLRTRAGKTVGERTFEDHSCQAIADATVVVLAWMVAPEAMAQRALPPPAQAPPPASPPAGPEPVPPPPPSARLAPFIGLGVIGDGGTLPSAALGATGRVGASLRPFRLAAHAAYWPSRSKTSSQLAGGTATGGTFTLWVAGVEACVGGRAGQPAQPRQLGVAACAGLERDMLHGAGFGVTLPTKASKAWFSVTAAVEGSVPLRGGLRLVLRVAGVLPTEREHFALMGVGEIYQPTAAAARATLGLELEL